MKLSKARQDYLKALYALGRQESPVTTSRLADRLGVSAPSVSAMLGRLAKERLVKYAPRAGASLTAEGRRQALDLVRCHRILETFLVRVLGLDWSEVHEDAEILEHHISRRVLDAIDRLVGHPAEDPHGHPIPDRHGRLPARRLSSFADLHRGTRATVRELRDADQVRMTRWKELGLVPGATVQVLEVREIDDVYELNVAGRKLTIGSEGLQGVMVQVADQRTKQRPRARDA